MSGAMYAAPNAGVSTSSLGVLSPGPTRSSPPCQRREKSTSPLARDWPEDVDAHVGHQDGRLTGRIHRISVPCCVSKKPIEVPSAKMKGLEALSVPSMRLKLPSISE